MFPSLLLSLSRLGRTWKPLNFSNPNFKIEEETIPDYVASRYYPVRIGEVFRNRYQIVGNLSFRTSSTVWLARDMNYCRYVTLKILIKSTSTGQQLDDELMISYPGRKAVRSLLDLFGVDGPDDKALMPFHRLPKLVLAFVLQRLFMALGFLHTKCQIIHTDIKADNIMFSIADDSGAPVLCNFGSAVSSSIEHSEDIQPNIYQAPEVILEAPWTCMVRAIGPTILVQQFLESCITDLGHLRRRVFITGHDPELQTYRSRAHLAEMISLLGPPPLSLLAQGKSSRKFFSDEGDFCAGIPLQDRIPLDERETTLEGQDKAIFLRCGRRCNGSRGSVAPLKN
ncbi:kinase-like protein [Aspergillus novofumigatus IBT 16806]|uniref:non-specific serine/threonine protein kinase n=1 Tax=Aspergillus novofumigatus (strain IBT 16806) TaxID=1392255 RepID=A0A2I1C3A2_ASPN1|nr:kinase-like protein [Aspergillus novofumigatus IBT 16806]PKX92112.1 kinase-like protein [Aspergillus novofumigatus IBT 16806]